MDNCSKCYPEKCSCDRNEPKKLTVEQIREVLFKFIDYDFIRNCMIDEINCGESDCRECLMSQFERVADDN